MNFSRVNTLHYGSSPDRHGSSGLSEWQSASSVGFSPFSMLWWARISKDFAMLQHNGAPNLDGTPGFASNGPLHIFLDRAPDFASNGPSDLWSGPDSPFTSNRPVDCPYSSFTADIFLSSVPSNGTENPSAILQCILRLFVGSTLKLSRSVMKPDMVILHPNGPPNHGRCPSIAPTYGIFRPSSELPYSIEQTSRPS